MPNAIAYEELADGRYRLECADHPEFQFICDSIHELAPAGEKHRAEMHVKAPGPVTFASDRG